MNDSCLIIVLICALYWILILQPIALHLLDIEVMDNVLKGVVMELQDCALPLLTGMLLHFHIKDNFWYNHSAIICLSQLFKWTGNLLAIMWLFWADLQTKPLVYFCDNQYKIHLSLHIKTPVVRTICNCPLCTELTEVVS